MTAHTRTVSLAAGFMPATTARMSTSRFVVIAASFLIEAVIVLGFVSSSLGLGVAPYPTPTMAGPRRRRRSCSLTQTSRPHQRRPAPPSPSPPRHPRRRSGPRLRSVAGPLSWSAMSFALSLGQIGTSVAPPPAASEAPTDVLLGLFILFVGAKLGEEVARRLGQPAVVGELLGGFAVGPYALGLVVPGETAAVFSELGVIILLFAVGLEVRLDDLLAVGRPAVLTAVIAMILPIAAGIGLGSPSGPRSRRPRSSAWPCARRASASPVGSSASSAC